jgi:predicted Fe-Mo cluster-binding NifX family protein
MEKDILKKLYKVQSEIGSISKDVTNPFYKSKYFDINSLIGQLQPLLKKHGLMLLQPIEDQKVKSVIVEIDGEGQVESAINLPDLQDPQKMGSAITYYRRYTLQSLLALQAEDDDGNKAITKVKPTLHYKGMDGKVSNQFKNAMDGMKNGKTINDIKNHYKVDRIIEQKLLNLKLD